MNLGRRARLGALVGLITAASILALAALPGARHSLLRHAGDLLVSEDAPGTADVIVVSIDGRAASVLEAADLFHAGVAPRIALFHHAPGAAETELARRGIVFRDTNMVSVQLLHALGIDAIEQIPEPVVGTQNEGEILERWCAQESIRSIVFVSTPDHSRRTRRVLIRALAPLGVHVAVRYSPYSDFHADSWWRSRDGQRTEIIELEKLLLDVVRHPRA